MNTTDNPNVDPSTVPYAKKAFNQGAIGALILVAIGLVMNLSGLVEPGKNNAMTWVANILNWVIIGYFIYAASTKHRDEDLGGFISYGRAFGVGAMVVLAITLISAVWTYIYMAFVDPGIFDTIREASMEQMINQQGMTEEQAEEALSMMSFMWNPGIMAVFAAIGIAIAGLIIDLIVSAVVKKDNPAFA